MSDRSTYVVVTVDTSGIEEIYGKAEKFVENPKELKEIPKHLVEFSDNRGDLAGDGTKFISKVNKSKDIIWIGISKKKDDTVQIKKFNHKGGKNILKQKFKYSNGVLFGKIKDNYQEGTEDYSLTFQINDSGQYEIDPQLQMTP